MLCELVLAAVILHLTVSGVQQKMWRASAISRMACKTRLRHGLVRFGYRSIREFL